MKQLHTTLLLTLFPLFSIAQYQQTVLLPNTSGADLLDSLLVTYRPTDLLDYDDARDTMYARIDRHGDSIRCIYTGFARDVPLGIDPSTHLYDRNSRQSMNAEHVYPQSKGASGVARADMHNLFPAKSNVNSTRSNNPYGTIPEIMVNKWFMKDQVLTVAPNAEQYYLYSKSETATHFEPRDESKGNIARAALYFYTIYRAEAEAADPLFFDDQINTLCAWHLADPVDSMEWQRTYAIAEYQEGKPNPFVLDCSLAGRTHCSNTVCEPTTIAVDEVANTPLAINHYPNPFDQQINISYDLTFPQLVLLEIYNAVGQKIATLASHKKLNGVQTHQWKPQDSPNGVYYYKLSLQSGTTTQIVTQPIVLKR